MNEILVILNSRLKLNWMNIVRPKIQIKIMHQITKRIMLTSRFLYFCAWRS